MSGREMAGKMLKIRFHCLCVVFSVTPKAPHCFTTRQHVGSILATEGWVRQEVAKGSSRTHYNLQTDKGKSAAWISLKQEWETSGLSCSALGGNHWNLSGLVWLGCENFLLKFTSLYQDWWVSDWLDIIFRLNRLSHSKDEEFLSSDYSDVSSPCCNQGKETHQRENFSASSVVM